MNGEKLPKVLIISHTCFSTTNSMGKTLAAYFKKYNPEMLAQFYIQSVVPEVLSCKNYYRITDYDVLKNILIPFKNNTGRKFAESDIVEAKAIRSKNTMEEKLIKIGRKKPPVFQLLRTLLWRNTLWKNKNFRGWVEEFNPDAVVLQPGDFTYMYKFAREIALFYKIPLIIHNSEAYYLKEKTTQSFLHNLYWKRFKREFERTMKLTNYCIYMCDLLKEDYDKIFDAPSKAILMSSEILPLKIKSTCNKRFIFSYAGNLGEKVGRCKPLIEIGRVLKELNLYIDVYSQTEGEHIRELSEENGIKFHGSISYEEVVTVLQNSDFVLHVENQSEFHKNDLKYAFSTKIADLLACGSCIIAYGPPEIASIKYLKDNNLACVIEKKEDILEKINNLIKDPEEKKQYIENALKQTEIYHNGDKNADAMNELIKEVVMKYKEA